MGKFLRAGTAVAAASVLALGVSAPAHAAKGAPQTKRLEATCKSADVKGTARVNVTLYKPRNGKMWTVSYMGASVTKGRGARLVSTSHQVGDRVGPGQPITFKVGWVAGLLPPKPVWCDTHIGTPQF